jgi:rhodanese-related sulfurtransferase
MYTANEIAHGQLHDGALASPETDIQSHAILDAAREAGEQAGLRYSGDVTPQEAWQLFSRHVAVLIDVRTVEERQNVGYVPETPHVAWATGNPMERNPRFIRELESKAAKLDVILLLCRSGKRSAAAAEAASKVGFKNVFNVVEGFEGEVVNGQGVTTGGWKSYDLPWVQD